MPKILTIAWKSVSVQENEFSKTQQGESHCDSLS
ncbi:hypothetical protein ABID59_004560 [Bradyrhizobium sp. S3.3.6]